jgi:hypothetical protein
LILSQKLSNLFNQKALTSDSLYDNINNKDNINMNTDTFVNSYDIFSTCLTNCDLEGKGYIYVKPTSEYKIFYKAKSDLDLNKQGFTPLTLKEIICLGYKFKQEIITQSDPDRNELILKFKSMGERKQQNERIRNRLVAFICGIWDRIKNFFQGYGFKTTANLSVELSLWLEKNKKDSVKPKEEDKISDIEKIDDNNISKIEVDDGNKEVKNDNTEIKVKETEVKNDNTEIKGKETKVKNEDSNKNNSVNKPRPEKVFNRSNSFLNKKDENWKRLTKDNSNVLARTSIARDFTYIEESEAEKANPELFAKDPTISVEGMLRHVTKTEKGKEIKLDCDDAKLIINIVLNGTTEGFTYNFIDWIKNQPTFNVTVMKDILGFILKRYQDSNVFDAEAIQLLMTFYMENKWNEELNSNNLPCLPTNHSLIIAISAMLLDKPSKDNNKTWAFMTWMSENLAFDVATSKSWIDVLIKKEKKHRVSLVHVIWDLLIKNLFGSRNDILDDLKKEDITAYTYINNKKLMDKKE